MLTHRTPDADLGGPVTSAPLVSSTTETSTRIEARRQVDVLAAERGQLAPAKAAEDREEDEQPVAAVGERVGQDEDLAQGQHRAFR